MIILVELTFFFLDENLLCWIVGVLCFNQSLLRHLISCQSLHRSRTRKQLQHTQVTHPLHHPRFVLCKLSNNRADLVFHCIVATAGGLGLRCWEMNQQLAAGIQDATENAEEAAAPATEDTAGIYMLLQVIIFIMHNIFFLNEIHLQSYALMSFVSVFSYSGFWDTGN